MKNPFKKSASPEQLEKNGDVFFEKGLYVEALEFYKKRVAHSQTNDVSIYEKLLLTHQKLEHVWTEDDMTQSLEWTMKIQELTNPQIKQVHEKLTPEYQKIINGIRKILMAHNNETQLQAIEDLRPLASKAFDPLIETLLALTKAKGTQT